MAFTIRNVLLSLLCGIIIFFSLYQYRSFQCSFIERAASIGAYPILKVSNWIAHTIKQQLEQFGTRRALHKELAVMRLKNKELLQELIKTHSLLWYRHQTAELIDYAQRYETTKQALVHIIAKQRSEHEQFFLVDAGSYHGIEQDMVAVYKNQLVGRVTEVYPLYSKLILITDKHCKIAAYCCSSKVSGIYQGNQEKSGYGSLLFISHLHKIKQHDLVISSGQGLVFPQGFGIGTIDSWSLSGLYYDITIKPFLDFDQLEYCYLIKKGNYLTRS